MNDYFSMIYQLCQEGRLKVVRIGGKGCRGKVPIPDDAIADFVKGCTSESED